jgi:16S rRNA (adenine1518-N6/adenine1519-N6)-dimethyltransferase
VTLYSKPAVEVDDVDSFFRLVRAGFTAPRKQLANSLAQGLGLPKPETIPLLEKAKIVPQRRAETLTLNQWAQLWRVFNDGKQT